MKNNIENVKNSNQVKGKKLQKNYRRFNFNFSSWFEATESLKKFNKRMFKKKTFVEVHLKINDELGSLPAKLEQIIKIPNSINISFESTVGKKECNIYWKIAGNETFNLLNISENESQKISKFCQEYICENVKLGKIGN